MPLESGDYIKDLNQANPTGGDPKSRGDDHIRLLKKVLVDSFPGFAGAVMVGGKSTGTAGTYVLTPDDPLVSYTENTVVIWSPNVVNTGAATINVSGLGARNILQADGTALRAGDLSQYVLMVDTGTEYRIIGVTKNYVDQLVFTPVLPGQPGGAAQYELITQNSVASWSLRSQLRRSLRTANVQLTILDQAQIIDFRAGGFTQTFALPALLTDGFHVTLKNSSDADVELEAPAAVSTVSGTIANPGSVTLFNVPAGLAIVAGDLVIVRRTSIPFAQRMVGTAASYTANAASTISTITNVGAVATLTTATPHGRTTGDSVTVQGATPADYNGTFIITVTGASTFTYTMLTTPASTAFPVGAYTAGSTLGITFSYRVDESGVAPVAISSITAGGSVATLTTATPHGLATGNYANLTGNTPAAYNGQYRITVTSPTTFTYTAGSAPGGPATVIGSYTLLFTDWTITARASTAGIDGKAAYLMYPGEQRLMQCNGVALNSYVENGFYKEFTTTGPIIKPPGYKAFNGKITGGGPSGMKSGSTATTAYGSGGAAALDFSLSNSALPDAGTLQVGAGGIGPTGTAPGAQGGNSTYAGMTAYGGGPGNSSGGGSGAGTLGPGVAGDPSGAVGGAPKESAASIDGQFGGANGTQGGTGRSVWGGGSGGANVGGDSVHGGAGGGHSASSVGSAGGVSTFGGNGGAGGNAGVSGANGSAPGGAGGATQTGAKGGDGGRGSLKLKGEM